MKMLRALTALTLALPLNAIADDVTAGDSIVQGSQCVGLDCANGEVFSFETLRLKENNTRLRFVDTSATSAFPTNDWELVANDSVKGGRNRFSIEDVDGAREIFTLSAGAPSFSLFVDALGRVGIGTSRPQTALHISATNSPTMRIEQNRTGGFPGVAWDIRANEVGFSVLVGGVERLRLAGNGNLTIGGTLAVSASSPFPDDVFRDNYALMPLAQVHEFVKTNGHLPEIPSAAEIERDGLNMTEIQLKLLKKIEELTLYTLQQQAQIDALRAQLQSRAER